LQTKIASMEKSF